MSGQPRLLLLADAFDNRGGGEVVVGHLANALRERWRVGVLTTTRGQDAVDVDGDLTVFRLHSSYHPRLRPLISLANPVLTPKVRSVIRRFRPDVAHAWNVHSHLSYDALRLIKRARVPIVLTYQDAQPFCYSKFKCWLDPERPCAEAPDYRADPRRCRSCRQHFWMFPPRNRLVREYLGRTVDQGISVSRTLADALVANRIAVHQVIYNGLPLDDSALIGADGRRARARHGWDDGPLLVTGGRLHFFKGQRQALLAFGRLVERRPNARLVILGDRNEFRDGLAATAAELGIADRVAFPGFLNRSEYYDCLAAADVFLNLSMYLDPFPTVNLEAMALGVPVIGSCYGGTPEAVEDGVSGAIVDPYDLDAVVERSLQILDDGPRREAIGRAGRERVAGRFPVDQMASAYEATYLALVPGGMTAAGVAGPIARGG